MNVSRTIVPFLLALSAGAAGGAVAQERTHGLHEHAAHAPAGEVPLYGDLGTHGMRITTSSPEAQAYFDQGLRLEYAFNHAEAIRSYREALRHDAGCALCWWGVALASGPNINAPMGEEGGKRAFEASRAAMERAGSVSELERGLIEALADRYAADPAHPRPPLDSAYAAAMEALADRFPGEPDVLTLAAAAGMGLSPWNYWEGGYAARTPREGTLERLGMLERALSLAPRNPGACHYYIHLVEAAFPAKAVECADRLAALMPGAGHLVHMPGHIYIRVGRWADAVRANEHAVHSDEVFIADLGASTLYTGAYYPHNYHFMAFAATMAGMSGQALEASRVVASKVSVDVAKQVVWLQNAVVFPHLTLLTFGRWREVLEEPLPSAELPMSMVLARYAQGVALAALGDRARAREALAAVRETADAADPAADPIPHIAAHALAGEIALRSGNAAGAVESFRQAAALEDALLYEEPPLWYYPIRQSLGRALLEVGRPAEAEVAYREDLDRFPENGWSLLGLARSLEAQGRRTEAAAAHARFREAWKHADVKLTASRF